MDNPQTVRMMKIMPVNSSMMKIMKMMKIMPVNSSKQLLLFQQDKATGICTFGMHVVLNKIVLVSVTRS